MKNKSVPSILLVMPKVLIFIIVSSLLFAASCNKEDTCRAASAANAGTDQSVSGTSTTLAGNKPDSGTGSWSIVSGAGGTISEASNPVSKFDGAMGTTYELKWTITGCPTSEDFVKITFSCTSPANAGPDQNVTSGVTTTLAANTPAGGSGIWSIVSGTGGNIASPSSPTSQFAGTLGATYILRWTIACSSTQDDVSITFVNNSPQLLSADKTSVINGEVITITGINFSANLNGGSQIVAHKTSDPFINQEVFLSIISRTATQIKVIMTGSNGIPGEYQLQYYKKTDATPATVFPSKVLVNVITPTANQFITSSLFTNKKIAIGADASFGIKNGSLDVNDYTIKVIDYDGVTGVSTEIPASVTKIVANSFNGGSMDLMIFTLPSALVSGKSYLVSVTLKSTTLFAGWGEFLLPQ